ncbi:hypothetical protein J2S78_003319 [Salibacterium salarium]|nr:hypothetical protein [Salibacterium salarium]
MGVCCEVLNFLNENKKILSFLLTRKKQGDIVITVAVQTAHSPKELKS